MPLYVSRVLPGGTEGEHDQVLKGGRVVGRLLLGQLELEQECHAWYG